jgi:hypothetical protein
MRIIPTNSDALNEISSIHIAALDPLDADRALQALPSMNAQADIRAIVSTLSDIIPPVERLPNLPVDMCSAMLRDIGLFLGSLKRHGVEPVDALPGLEPVLLQLGRRVNMVPRDTVFHYTECNPDDIRRRTYTGENQEIFLADATRMTLSHLTEAVALCQQLSGLEPGSAQAPTFLNTLAAALDSFETSIDMVTDKVDPKFFAEVLRPYFQEIEVGGLTYLGPAASHVPVFLIDLALWASDHGSDDYAEFRLDSTRYTFPRWRRLALEWEGNPSFLSRLTAAHTANRDGIPERIQASAEAFGKVMRTLIRFRGKHLSFARRTYNSGTCGYEAGSGGGTVDLLQEILGLTRQSRNLVTMTLSHDGRVSDDH